MENFERLPSLAKFHKAFKKWVCLEISLLYLTFFLGSFLIVLLSVQTSASVFLRIFLIFIFLAGSLSGLVFFIFQFRKRTRLVELCRILRAKSLVFRDLVSGLEFSTQGLREGVSEDLSRAAISSVEENLKQERTEAWFSYAVLKSHTQRLALVISVLGMTIVFPPHLFQSGWNRLLYGFKNEIVTPTPTPMDFPRLTDFSVTLKLPSYTGLAPITLSEPQIHTYRGTEVEIIARATNHLESAEILSREGLRYLVTISRGKTVRTNFKVHNPMEFWFELKDTESRSPPQPIHYSVTIKEDSAPKIQILAPSDDLWVGQETVIPFTYEVRDDLGVQEIYLNAESQKQGSAQRILLKRYDPAAKEKIDETPFNLSSLKPCPGEMIRLRLEARDTDTLTGPKPGFSNWMNVEVRSYESEHEAIEKDLAKFREDLLNLLSDQTLASVSRKDWQALSKNPEDLNRKVTETSKAQAQAGTLAKKIEENLKKIIDKIEKDPLSDFSSWSEHKALHEGLKLVREGAMSRAQNALESKDLETSSLAQEEAVSQIEKLSHLSEEIQKFSNMRNLTQSADSLESKSRKLTQRLTENSRLTTELKEEIAEILKEAFKILEEISKSIRDLPQELPEDFVNRSAVKNMNLEELVNSLTDLSRSLERGDIQSALKIAQDMLKLAQAAREALALAAQETSMDLDRSLAEKNSESQNRLNGLISRQEEILRKTYPFESKRREQYFETQKKILKELAARQSEVIQEARKIPDAALALPKMEKVLKELENQNVIFSQKWLEEITALAISSGIVNSEMEILSVLKKPPQEDPEIFSAEDRQAMKRLSEEQKRLSEDTNLLAGDISKMGSSSAMVKSEMVESIQNAALEMESARSSLEKGESEAALPAQESALSHLSKGQEMMQDMGESLSQMKSMRGGRGGSGQSQAGRIQPKSSGSGSGGTGSRHGGVKIPGAQDYLPPKEFREDILESLKEKYPQSQSDLIKDYFKRLTR